MNLDKDFLLKLDSYPERKVYIKITSLNFNEKPLQTIEGRATGGSINVDGSSAVRRTCQLSLVTTQVDISDYFWTLDTKFKVEVGLENSIDTNYPEIIWFNQGIYIINSFSSSYSPNGYTVNISGKDKMCMLNGEVGGTLNSSVDFGTIQEIDKDGNIRLVKLPLKQIIREAVHQYGNEPFYKIIINDLDDLGLELQEYQYTNAPLYIWREADTDEYIQGTLNSTITCYNVEIWNEETQFYDKKPVSLKELPSEYLDPLQDVLLENIVTKPITFEDKENAIQYCVAKIENGQTAGYKETPLVYPDELICNSGENITTLLDKIVKMLGEFEYFYDLDGYFVFQAKRTYINTSWNPIEGSAQVVPYMDASPYFYNFEGSKLFTSFNNSPNISSLKNDYTVWGTRQGIGGGDISVHMRYVIDEKPIQYTRLAVAKSDLREYNEKYGFDIKPQNAVTYVASDAFAENENGSISCDWRELIYRMALDYRKFNHLDDFEQRVSLANPDYYPTGKTGYEQYYIDMEGFWRQLYNYEPIYDRVYNPDFDSLGEYYIRVETEKYNKPIGDFDAEETYYIKNKDGSFEEVKMKDKENFDNYYIKEKVVEYKKAESWDYLATYYTLNTDYDTTTKWHKNVIDHPEQLNFWFDFLDTTGELNRFSVPAVGIRSKVTNDNSVKAIYYKETPLIIFQSKSSVTEGAGEKTGYRYFNVAEAGFNSMFKKSTQGKSAKTAIDDLLYNHSYCVESVSINSIPIYHLEPNTIIYISDLEAGINGEYILNKFTIPLTYNGTMSMTAIKAPLRLL